MTSESTANVIRGAIADPDDAKQKQHKLARHHDEETQCKRAVRYAGETHSNASQNPVDGFAENHHRHQGDGAEGKRRNHPTFSAQKRNRDERRRRKKPTTRPAQTLLVGKGEKFVDRQRAYQPDDERKKPIRTENSD